MNKNDVVIASNNQKFIQFFENLIDNEENIRIIGNAEDENSIRNIIESDEPDIILMQVSMNGFKVLEFVDQVHKNTIHKKTPEFIFVSGIEEGTNENYNKRELRYYRMYSAEKSISAVLKKKNDGDPENMENERQIVADVTKMIQKLEIPANIKGYQYVRDAVIMVAHNMELIHSVTKTLYPDIAKKNNSSRTQVERAIRHAIEVVWNRGNPETLEQFFGYSVYHRRGKPTNSEFIAVLADKIRLDRGINHIYPDK